MPEKADAPTHAALLRDFVNTLDVETGAEALASPEALARWLSERGLADQDTLADSADFETAIVLREGLRAAMAEHHDRRADRPRPELDAVCAAFPLRVSFRPDGPALKPVHRGVRGGLARIVAALVDAVADGTWQRLKLCAEGTCQCAFLDSSKNRSRHWCSMEICGNRNKTRAYRARRRTGQDARPERTGA